jgi:hypothetical protein
VNPNPGKPETQEHGATTATVPEGWTRLPLEHLPSPTFWPAGLALGITFIFWSLITSWVVLVIGIALFAASLAGWISDLLHESKQHP